MSYLPTPDYGLLKNIPQPDPIGAGLEAYKTVATQRRAEQATALAQRLGTLQEQKARIAVKNLPLDEALKQHQTQLANQASQLQIYNAKKTIHDTSLADLHEAPEDQKEPLYQKHRKDMAAMGGDVSKLPLHYDQEVETEANTAYQKSPQGGADRKYARDVAMQQLKNIGTVQAAEAKAKARPAKESAFMVAQGKQLSKDVTTVNTAAQEAQTKSLPLWNEVGNLLDKVVTGPGVGRIDWRSGDAQRLRQLITQAQGEYVKTFHLGRMTQYEFKLLQKAVGDPTMYKSVLKKIVRDHLRSASEAIEQQKFANNYVKQGGRSTVEMSNQWVKEVGDRRQADLEATAKANNMTVAQVKQRLGM